MTKEPETFESIVADYGRVADAREEAVTRAEELHRKAATGLPEFKAIRLRGAEQARKEAAGHEAEILRIIDRLEMLQRRDLTVPRLNDTAAIAVWRQQLREARAERARMEQVTEGRDLPLDGDARTARLQSLDEWAAMLVEKIQQAEAEQDTAANAEADVQG